MTTGLTEDSTAIRYWQAIKNETDRGMAVLAFAYLDDRLTEAIRSHFANDKRTADNLFAGAGPLNSFMARANLAYCLGFYGPKTLKDLVDRI